MTTGGVPSSANWQELYQRAILETNRANLLPLIADAHKAILDRIEETLTRPNSAEHQQLNDALHGLCHLRHEVHNWQSNGGDSIAEQKVG